MSSTCTITQEPSAPLTFRIEYPLSSDDCAAISLTDLIKVSRDHRPRADTIAEAERRFRRAAIAKVQASEIGSWLIAFAGKIQWESRDLFLDDGPLLLTFENASAAMLFKLTWA